MTLWQRMLGVLGFVRPANRSFHFDADLVRSLRLLAEYEQRPEDEVAADLLSFALTQRGLVEDNLRRWQELSFREQQVAALVCLDYTNRQIAACLSISPETVKTHVGNALKKFAMHSKPELRAALSGWDWDAWRSVNIPS
jgi:DNA-binding CsgD family transcriptional regulator